MSKDMTKRNGQPLSDELGRDMEVASWLSGADPASVEANYWLRFQSRVLKAAAPELARRRLMAELTLGDVMTSWARAVVPTAVLAAALTGFLLLRSPAAPGPTPVGVEELLLAEVEGSTIPATLELSESASAVTFASEGF